MPRPATLRTTLARAALVVLCVSGAEAQAQSGSPSPGWASEAEPELLRLRLETSERDVALFLASSFDDWLVLGLATFGVYEARVHREPVFDAAHCMLPCDVGVPPGDHHFGFSRDGSDIHTVHLTVEAGQPRTLEVDWVDNSTLRIVGILLSVVGLVGLVAVPTVWAVAAEPTAEPLFLGLGLSAVGAGVGLAFAFAGDGVEWRFRAP